MSVFCNHPIKLLLSVHHGNVFQTGHGKHFSSHELQKKHEVRLVKEQLFITT